MISNTIVRISLILRGLAMAGVFIILAVVYWIVIYPLIMIRVIIYHLGRPDAYKTIKSYGYAMFTDELVYILNIEHSRYVKKIRVTKTINKGGQKK